MWPGKKKQTQLLMPFPSVVSGEVTVYSLYRSALLTFVVVNSVTQCFHRKNSAGVDWEKAYLLL